MSKLYMAFTYGSKRKKILRQKSKGILRRKK